MYKLKTGVSLPLLIKDVQKCKADVLFLSGYGDTLNLKSALSQFIFAAAATKPGLLIDGQIICNEETDYKYLCDYLIKEDA